MSTATPLMSTDRTAKSVALFVPNLIGYFRLLCYLITAVFIRYYPIASFIIYFLGVSLDAFDGMIARKLDQQSRFGAILDFSVDRAGDCILYIILLTLYPTYWAVFLILLMLDMMSHISQVYVSTFIQGKNHKAIAKQQGKWISAYYRNRLLMLYACFSHDMFIAGLYLYHFFPGKFTLLWSIMLLPGFIYKNFLHVLQMISSFKIVADLDVAEPLDAEP